MRSLSRYERAQLTPELIHYHQEHNRKVAQQWAETWNLVETGHCGACQKPLAEIKGHENEKYPAVGYHRLERTLCFYCACSQED